MTLTVLNVLRHQQLYTNWKHKLAAWNNWTSLFSTELNIRASLIVLPQATPLQVTSFGCNHTAFDLRYNVLINLNSCNTHHGPLLYTSAHQTVVTHIMGHYFTLQHTKQLELKASITYFWITRHRRLHTWIPHAWKSTASSTSDMASARSRCYDSITVQTGVGIPEGSQVRHRLPTRHCCHNSATCAAILPLKMMYWLQGALWFVGL